MEFYELMENLEKNYEEKEMLTSEELREAEVNLIEAICPELLNAKIQCTQLGKGIKIGQVIDFYNTNESFENFGIKIQFEDGSDKVLILKPLATTSHFNKIVDEVVLEKCVKVCDVHNNLFGKYAKYNNEQRRMAIEAEKKAKAEQKLEEKFKKLKEKAIKDFDELSSRAKVHSEINDFYFSLGWLAKNAGTLSAAMPDYLESAFVRCFGPDTGCRVVDSSKRGPAGYQSQWYMSFNLSIKNNDSIPTYLTQYLNPKGNALTNTHFLWDLVEDYGFQFGKKQDALKIAKTIPAKFIDSFNEGLA